MSKASKFRDAMAQRPVFMHENSNHALNEIRVSENGELYIYAAGGMLFIDAKEALRFGKWLVETFGE